MTKSPKPPQAATLSVPTPATPANLAFKAIGLPAVAAATRRKPQGRTERRVGLVLDPVRYTD